MANTMPDPEEIPPELWKRLNITKERFLEIRAMMEEREKRTPPVGSPAPDFELERLSPEGERTGEAVRLAAYRGRPLALVFGSYT